ncbi:MAG: ATP-dependent Clp protease adaptor ClpS [Bacteroidota bacterium]|nr:ATP-dependent Clp protease adaptor ClpS [Bacteroidota bacterium]
MTEEKFNILEKHKQENEENQDVVHNYYLILHNDDIHTFDFVIDSLMEVCKHDLVQATQCAYLTHHKGKCDVLKGEYAQLKPLKIALIERELIASIDTMP